MLKALYRQMMLSQGAGRPISFEVARAEELVRAGEHEAARSVLEPYLSSYPLSGHALHVAGLIELSQGSPAAAVEAIKRAVRAEPANPMIRANFALALWRCGALEEARGELEIALRDLPMMFEPSLNLIQIHLALGDPLRAYRVLMHALEHEFEFEPVDAAKLWLAQAALEPFFPGIDGPACIRRAAELDPNVTGMELLGYMSYARRCDWSYPTSKLVDFLEIDTRGPRTVAWPVFAPAEADCVPVSRQARYDVASRCAAVFSQRVARLEVKRDARTAKPSTSRIRLAYLSADFHSHPTMYLLCGVLANHDRSRFELFAYSIGPDDANPMRDQVRALFDVFSDMASRSPLAIAQRIFDDDIDILVDLNGYVGAGMPEVAALRPAPVQVSYLGYPGTVAADFVDYLIADNVVVRPGEERWYSERIVYMPFCYQPTDNAQRIAGDPASREAAGLPREAFVFCSFNSTYKIEPLIFGVWMDILHAVPGSVLWVLADHEEARANLANAAVARGIARERLVFANSLPRERHLARMSLGDLFLDTHFVNAHTTASDAIWAGLPLITASGDSFSSRVAASILRAAGLDELVCADLECYRSLAITLAHDRSRIAALRQRCVDARSKGPLFDTQSYTHYLEAAYGTMHAIRLAAASPTTFCVPRRLPANPC